LCSSAVKQVTSWTTSQQVRSFVFEKCKFSHKNAQSGCIAGDNFVMAPGTTHLANDGISWTCTSSNAGARLDMTFVKSRVSKARST
jgi:hypothetical protein